MDPNAAWKEICDLARDLATGAFKTPEEKIWALTRLADLSAGLREWLERGGFAPEAWRAYR